MFFKSIVAGMLALAVVAVDVDDSPRAGRRPGVERRAARRARRSCHGVQSSPATRAGKTSVSVTTGG